MVNKNKSYYVSVQEIYDTLKKRNIIIAKNVIYRNIREIKKYLKKGNE